MKTLITLAALFAMVMPQAVSPWAQCGGDGYAGTSECADGYSCVVVNEWYSQCQTGTGTATLATPTVGSSPTTSSTANGSGKLMWMGVDESGAEWGTVYPGTEGVDYFFPSTTAIGALINEGYNIFRVPFAMERMAVGTMTASLNSDYLTPYAAIISYITSNGAHAVVDAHNYGRYNGAIITDTTGFRTFWTNVATAFQDNPNVIFDINNEYNTMDESLVFDLNQAGINGIRAAGATSQYIFAEGNSWTGASTWNTTNDSLKTLNDPYDLLIFEMHQYLNSDGSGSSADCISSTIGVELVEGATAWLQENGKLGVLGEFAGGPNTVCMEAITGLLNHLETNSDVWLGAVWWSAGPAWPAGTYGDFEPPSGTAYEYYDTLLKSYVV